jgi:hypothetical protein
VERQRALDNSLEPDVVYAEIKPGGTEHAKGKRMLATQKLILPLLQKSGEPAVEALGNLHLVSEDHFAELAIGIQTAMAMSGRELPKPKPKHKPRVRRPKKKALVACEKLQADNLASRTEDRLDVLDYAEARGVHLPIRRRATPKSEKDAAMKRQRCPDDPTQVYCGHDSLCATKETNEALQLICPGVHGRFPPKMMQHANTWSVWDQIKKGIWGEDTNNEVHMLTRDCHKKVDELLIQAQAAERRAEAAKARAAAEHRAETAD